MSRKKTELTVDLLRSLIAYNKETGFFTWRFDRQGHTKAGAIAGSMARNGYIDIMVLGRRYGAHRLAWLWITGNWPEFEIDHINGIRMDNRWLNLRNLTVALNRQNQRRPHRDNKCGFLGVSKNGNRFAAHIQVNKVPMYIGTYDTPEDAHAAYVQAKRKLHPAGML